MESITKCTQCEFNDCPQKADSEKQGCEIYPSYCINISPTWLLEDGTIQEDKPFWACLPCAYKGGAVI